MTSDAERFTDAHRHSFSVCLAQLADHIRTLRGFGVDAPPLGQLEQELDAFAAATGATRPQPPRDALNATLVQMLVLEEELRPRRMRGYGARSDGAERLLDKHVQRLVDLTLAEVDEAKREKDAFFRRRRDRPHRLPRPRRPDLRRLPAAPARQHRRTPLSPRSLPGLDSQGRTRQPCRRRVRGCATVTKPAAEASTGGIHPGASAAVLVWAG